jgi:hypothetical protein
MDFTALKESEFCQNYDKQEDLCDYFKNKADFVEVKHGRWKGAGLGDYYCSLCCETYSGGDSFNFCPHCGADMRKEGADNG